MKVLLHLLLGTGFHHILQQGDAAGRRWWAVSKSAGSQSHDTWRSSSPLTCKNMENPSALEASYLRLGISSSHLSEGLPSLSSVFTMISWFPAFALLEGWSPEGWTSASWFSCNSSIRLLTSAWRRRVYRGTTLWEGFFFSAVISLEQPEWEEQT